MILIKKLVKVKSSSFLCLTKSFLMFLKKFHKVIHVFISTKKNSKRLRLRFSRYSYMGEIKCYQDEVEFIVRKIKFSLYQFYLDILLFTNPAGNYMFKVNNRNTTARCEICSKLTKKTPERRQWRHSRVFIVNFEYISHLALVLLLLTLSR